jgi:hypothetical protein
MTFILRKTVIGGETLDDDYTVHFDGLQIGRIFRKIGVSAQEVWSWDVQSIVKPAPGAFGTEDTLDAAKAAFKASWDAFWPTLSEADIAEWRRVQALVPSWERRRNKS